MRILVTGATGFLGRAVVRALASSGHEVVALARPAADSGMIESLRGASILRGDLRQKTDWCDSLADIDVVVHAAAGTGGSFPDQFASSVVATENLLDCLDWRTLRRFVLVSSFSVYDYSGPGRRIDETHPIERDPSRRDAYTWTKMLQEDLVVEACRRNAVPLTSIRPGAIYGPGKTWDGGAALSVGRFDLIFSPFAKLRLTHVDNCAEAIAAAAQSETAEGVYNIVDDDPPSHARFHRASRRAGHEGGIPLFLPWWFVAGLGQLVRATNAILFRKRARLPEILDYPRQQARWRPFSYSNARAKAELGWTPRVRLDEGVRSMLDGKPSR